MKEQIIKLLQLCEKLQGDDFQIDSGMFMISLQSGTFRFYVFGEKLYKVDIRPGDTIEFSHHFMNFTDHFNYCIFIWERMANEFKSIEDGI